MRVKLRVSVKVRVGEGVGEIESASAGVGKSKGENEDESKGDIEGTIEGHSAVVNSTPNLINYINYKYFIFLFLQIQ